MWRGLGHVCMSVRLSVWSGDGMYVEKWSNVGGGSWSEGGVSVGGIL